jgi:formylglycine-generating enzyme required for sulfatase activity
MLDFLKNLKQKFSDAWLKLSVNLYERSRRESPTFLYALAAATALAPVVTAPNFPAAFGNLAILLGGLGIEALGNLLEELRTKDSEAERLRLLEAAVKNSTEVREVIDLLLEKAEALPLAQQAFNERNTDQEKREWFANAMAHALQQVGSRLSIQTGSHSAVSIHGPAIQITGQGTVIYGSTAPIYVIPNAAAMIPPPPPSADVKTHYLDYVRNEHERIRLFGFDSEENLFVFLQDVFVSLRLSEHRRKAEAFAGREGVSDQLLTPQKILPAATARHRLLLVTGDPGCGKTTLLKYFALSCLDEEKRRRIGLTQPLLPVFLPLRKVDPKLSFTETLSRWASNRNRPVAASQFEEWLDRPGALLLLDGLDEISDQRLRLQVCEWISEAHSAYGASTFVVTCRFTGFGREESQALRADHFHADMQNLNLDEQRTFLEKWFFAAYRNDQRALHPEKPDDLEDLRQQALDAANAILEFVHREENRSLRFMAGSPVLLQIIAIIWKERGNLSTERAALYHRCTQFLLDHRDRAKGIDPLMSAEKARLLLRPLALWMQEKLRKDEAPTAELVRRLAQPLQEIDPSLTPQKFLENLRDRAGLLQTFGDEAYIFRHKSFREYLASAELARQSQSQPQRVQVFVDNFDDNWWREPTVFAAGFAEPFVFPELMEALLKSDKNTSSNLPLLLQLVREAAAKPLAPFEKTIRNQKLAWQKRYNALQCVRLLRSEAAIKLVKMAQRDKEPKVRQLAEQILIEWLVAKPPEVPTAKANRFFNPVEDNAEYILIPAGKYKFSETGQIVEVPDLYFAKYPVTNKLYNIFLESLPKSERGKHRSSYADDKRFNGDDQPVVGVSWYSAMAYCEWLTAKAHGKMVFRLPAEIEWEWAASGGKRKYPWGNPEPDDSRANYGSKVGHTTPVGSYPAGATPEGLMDMAGNVWEWCLNGWNEPDFVLGEDRDLLKNWRKVESLDWRVVRGGAWNCRPHVLACAIRSSSEPTYRLGSIGFRCART